MSQRLPLPSRLWLALAAALTFAKLWLTLGQPIYAIGFAMHDDALYLKLARSIVRGEWLGAYDQMTLAKGPFYPIFAAAVFWIGLPLSFAQQLLYTAACAVWARALRPAFRSLAFCLGVYALLMLNPMSWEAPTNGRILRQAVYTPLGLMVFGAIVALYCRRHGPLRRQAPWAALLGLALGCFWMTREESIWIAPSVAVLLGGWGVATGLARPAAARRIAAVLGLAAACTAAPLLVVSALNHRHYGWFGTVEMRAQPLQDAYGAMTRVRVGPDLPFVPVTREAREAIYRFSPTAAKLRPHLEGDYGRGWADASTYTTKLPPERLEIGSGWFVWALRDCTAAAGEAPDAARAMAFYQRMADEINAACDSGQLPSRPRRSGFFPAWRSDYNAELVRTLVIFTDFVVTYESFGARPLPSLGDENDLQLFRDLTRDQLSPKAAGPNLEKPAQEWLDRIKQDTLQRAGDAMRPTMTTLLIVAHVLAFLRLVQLLRARTCTFAFAAAVAAWGGTFAYLLLNALVHVTSFPVIAVSTFAPVYPWMSLFVAMVAWDVLNSWLPGATVNSNSSSIGSGHRST
jgi:hypothetical protein